MGKQLKEQLMTENDEALLFAKQTGTSARLTPGEKIRANIFGGEEVECGSSVSTRVWA